MPTPVFRPGQIVLCVDPSSDGLRLQEAYFVVGSDPGALSLEPVRPGPSPAPPLSGLDPALFRAARFSGPSGADAYRLRSAFFDELPPAARYHGVLGVTPFLGVPEGRAAYAALREAMEAVAEGRETLAGAEASVLPAARGLARALAREPVPGG